MKKYVKEVCLIGISTLLIVILFMQIIAVNNVEKINRGLKNEIEYLESRVEIYENNEAWFEDYIDLLDEIWKQEVEIAVLEERLKNQPSNEDETTDLDTYDYYLMIVVSRQRLNQDTFVYVLHEAGTPLTSDNITHISDELWSVGEFVIAIEIDEEGNVFYTDLNATTDVIVDQFQEQIIDDFELVIELQQHYYQENITTHSFGDWLQINYPALYQRLLNYF